VTQTKRLQGMILAAGLGTRLRPLTLSRPKPLMEVIGQPLINYILRHMHKANVEHIVINTHYLGQQIVNALGPNFQGVPLSYIFEKEILGTGGALKNASELLQPSGSPILLMNGDILIDLNIAEFMLAHEKKQAIATLMLKTVPCPQLFGAIGTDVDDQIRSMVNFIPYQGPPLLERMFCGTHLLSPQIWHAFPFDKVFSIVDAFYAPLIRAQKLIIGLEQRGYYGDLGTTENLFQVNMNILSGEIKFVSYDFFERFERAKEGVWLGREVMISESATLIGPVVIDDGAEIQAGAKIGPYAVIGKRCVIGKNAEIAASVAMSGTKIASHEICQQMILDKEYSVQVSRSI
jgi:NDP-sugar pyrophosphorylase family protein